MNSSSAQHAALRILLEDVEPLLVQAEAVTATLTRVRQELNADLTTLGELVQRTSDAQPELLESARKLTGSAGRIEAALTSHNADSTASFPVPRARHGSGHLVMACTASAALAALLVAGLMWPSRATVEQARIGRALQVAWPSLDVATRSRLQSLMGKS